MKFVSILLPFIVYFLGGMIAWDIYSASLSDDIGIIDYIHRQVLTYNLVATAYIAIWLFIKTGSIIDQSKDITITTLIPIASYFITQHLLPASTGADILNVIICIGAMIFIGYVLSD